ncbi:MAG: hypothetical protein GQ533_11030 [Methanosarcinaceae archaeon]|nr:hypothetical protein [Methanosarcinaceae archaeon]
MVFGENVGAIYDAGLKMWAVGDIKLITILVGRVSYCMRFLLNFVEIWEMFSYVEIPVVVCIRDYDDACS